MKLQYIGTAGAEGFPGMFCDCPACNRARSAGGHNLKTRSCAILNDSVLLDAGPDLYAQSVRYGIRLCDVSDLVMTHTHSDHLDLFSMSLRARDGATILPSRADEDNFLTVHGTEAVEKAIHDALAAQPHAKASRIRFQKAAVMEPFQAENLTFYPLMANHKPDELCLIYAITDGTGWFLYANDTGALSDQTLDNIGALGAVFDVVSMDCARGTLPGDGHMGIAEATALRDRLLQMGCAGSDTKFVLNHFSHMCGLTPDEFAELVKPDGFTLAYDGLCLTI